MRGTLLQPTPVAAPPAPNRLWVADLDLCLYLVGVCLRGVRGRCRVVDNIFQIHHTFLLTGPDRLLDRVEHHRGRHC